ncbi:hypothetical protein B0J14DRAFT_696965 [Halenospora varia]|nr:hypothetical protein B0J14DRAFT_696965 [Halenospora varia]
MRLIPTVFLTSMSTIALAGNFYQTCDYVSEVNLSNVFFVLIAKYKDVNGNSNDASIDLNALVANIHGLGGQRDGNFIARCFAPAREVRENYLACCCAGSGYSSVDLNERI